jgi:SAM-dependent methyltransferase
MFIITASLGLGQENSMGNAPSSDDSVIAHYNERYFAWQSHVVSGTAVLEVQKFTTWIKRADHVLDFGCGNGAVLKIIECAEKLGVEINPHARAAASLAGIETVPSLAEVPDASFDVIISNHVLEHTTAPMDILTKALAKLKPGGTAVFVVPCERYDTHYTSDNEDQHLYTWSPMNLGNLFRHSGFEVEHVARLAHRWPPHVDKLLRFFGVAACNAACRIYAKLRPKLTQIRIVAHRPMAPQAQAR